MVSPSIAVYLVAALALCCCSCSCWSPVPADTGIAEGPSLAEMSRVIESYDLSNIIGYGNTDDDDGGNAFQGRGKKPKPGKIMMMMGGTAAMSMMIMKAGAAIKLFIIHSFLATKLGLIIFAYLLLCKLMEMKQPPPKKVIKWSPPPPSHDEHPMPMMHHPVQEPSYEPHQEQQPPQPADQYGPPQQFMPSSMGDYGGSSGGGGGDIQGHYSHISPVTYRPMINRNPPDNKAVGRRK